MSSEEFTGVLRAVIAGIGGWAVGKGYADAETVTTIGGVLTTIAVALWSIRAKRAAAKNSA